MTKNKKIGLLFFILLCVLTCIIVYMGFTGPVYINNSPVTGVTAMSEAGKKYLKQYPNNDRFFKDAALEKKYIERKCVVKSKLPLFLAKLFNIRLNGRIIYSGKDGLTLKDTVIRACKDYNERHKKNPVNASAVYSKKKRQYELIKGQNGKKLYFRKVMTAYYEGKRNLDLTPDVVKPDVTDKMMKSVIKEANEALKWHVDYTKGYTIQYPSKCIKIENQKLTIKEYDFHDELLRLDDLYNTAGEKKTVKLHNGKKNTTNKGTWGDLTDSAKEREYLLNAFDERKSEKNRTPVIKERNPKLIIEVDKEKQHVWVYKKDGAAVMDSDCVTGRRGVHDTPKGIFFISQVSKNYTMKGDGYTSFCQRFMRITNTGVALHDAPWRSRFGGNIYTYNGSHGCINLPTAFALKLADKITVGNTMVIVHS